MVAVIVDDNVFGYPFLPFLNLMITQMIIMLIVKITAITTLPTIDATRGMSRMLPKFNAAVSMGLLVGI